MAVITQKENKETAWQIVLVTILGGSFPAETKEYYHVRINLKNELKRASNKRYELDISYGDLNQYIIIPYKNRVKLHLKGDEIIEPYKITSIEVSKTLYPLNDKREKWFTNGRWHYKIGGEIETILKDNDITRIVMNSTMTNQSLSDVPPDPPGNETNIFIVHGHDDASKNELSSFLYNIGLRPIILHEQPKEGRAIIEQFEKYAAIANYAFVLLTPDDIGGKSRRDLKPRARQNVILEMGYFMGKLGRSRVCCLLMRDLDPPSDIHGILFIKYKEKIQEIFYEIRKEIRKAGYKIND